MTERNPSDQGQPGSSTRRTRSQRGRTSDLLHVDNPDQIGRKPRATRQTDLAVNPAVTAAAADTTSTVGAPLSASAAIAAVARAAFAARVSASARPVVRATSTLPGPSGVQLVTRPPPYNPFYSSSEDEKDEKEDKAEEREQSPEPRGDETTVRFSPIPNPQPTSDSESDVSEGIKQEVLTEDEEVFDTPGTSPVKKSSSTMASPLVVQVSNPVYFADLRFKGARDLQKFLEKFEQMSSLNNWTPEQQYGNLIMHIEGAALDCIKNDQLEKAAKNKLTLEEYLKAEPPTYASVVKLLKDCFEYKESEEAIKRQISAIKRTSYKTAAQFYYAIMHNINRLNPTIDNASKIVYILRGLPRQTAESIFMREPTDPAQVLKYLQQSEKFRSEIMESVEVNLQMSMEEVKQIVRTTIDEEIRDFP